MTTFDQFNLPPALKATLAKMNFTTPTPVQAQTIPLAIEGRDILATAMTGSGKTGAFGIPIISKMLSGARGSALILTPTRELATQVADVITQLLGQLSPIKTALLIGGESMPLQLQQLRARPRILIGTPGRVNDHLGRGSLMLHDAGTLVLDEMDRMLDMGFEDQIMAILRYLPATRQTLLFSATLPPAILKISQKYLKNPARIEVGETNKAVAKIDQQIIQTSDHGKYAALLEQLRKREGTIIIFVRTKQGTEKLATKLRKDGQSADAIHGDLEQYQRERVLQAFRDKQHRILVATDIAARGLDITHIEHVINYDLPMQPEDYIHRIGRTARAGAEGEAVSFITPHDLIKWREIQKLMNPGAEPPALPAFPQGSGDGEHSGGERGGRSGGRGGRSGGRSERSSHGHRGGHSGGAPAQAGGTTEGGGEPKRRRRGGRGRNRSEGGQGQASGQNRNPDGNRGGNTNDTAKPVGPIHGLPKSI